MTIKVTEIDNFYKLKHFLPKDTSLLEGSLQGNQKYSDAVDI